MVVCSDDHLFAHRVMVHNEEWSTVWGNKNIKLKTSPSFTSMVKSVEFVTWDEQKETIKYYRVKILKYRWKNYTMLNGKRRKKIAGFISNELSHKSHWYFMPLLFLCTHRNHIHTGHQGGFFCAIPIYFFAMPYDHIGHSHTLKCLHVGLLLVWS